nr:MarR family transcriptional regulator [Planomonospora venezuelensis]
MADRLGVNVTDLTCLGFILEAAEDPITAGRLAERAGLTTGAVTGVVNRLEKAGYVRRLSDSDDRRRIRIVPEGDAAARVTAAYEPVYRRLIALFEDYGPGELGVISDWFTRAAEIMRLSLAEIREPEAP